MKVFVIFKTPELKEIQAVCVGEQLLSAFADAKKEARVKNIQSPSD